jgi:hypothetical protein
VRTLASLTSFLLLILDQVNNNALTSTILRNRYISGKDYNINYTTINIILPYNLREREDKIRNIIHYYYRSRLSWAINLHALNGTRVRSESEVIYQTMPVKG